LKLWKWKTQQVKKNSGERSGNRLNKVEDRISGLEHEVDRTFNDKEKN
jgi:hypothetical protein